MGATLALDMLPSKIFQVFYNTLMPSDDLMSDRIRLRTAPIDSITIRILPGLSRSQLDKLTLLEFGETAESLENLPILMEAAERKMGLPARSEESHFSEDTLQIEVHGPTLPRLTLIDLPGLIRTGNQSHIDLVTSITERYIQNKRSIILAVVGAHYDRQNQEITKMATKYDPNGERTFGVITKPDTTERGTPGEQTWIKLAQNLYPGFIFHNGWHVLLNRNETEVIENTSTEERNEKERQFFEDPAREWSKVNPENWGAQKLKESLVRLLVDHLKRQLPSLKMEIEKKLIPIQEESRRLAASLKSKEDAGDILRKRCADMRNITSKAAEGTYNDNTDYFKLYDQPKWLEDPRLLRSKIEIEADKFQTNMKSGGRHLQSTWNPEKPPRPPRWKHTLTL